MNRIVATNLLAEFTSIRARLNQTLWTIHAECNEEEFKRYRKAIGLVMGELFLEVVTPIYNEHPDLVPGDLRSKNSDVTSKKHGNQKSSREVPESLGKRRRNKKRNINKKCGNSTAT